MDNLFLCEYLGTRPRSSKFIDKVDQLFSKTIPWIRISSCWRGQMASIESRMNIFHLLNSILIQNIKGDIVEIGCHIGESTVILQQIVQKMDASRNLYAFDSFCGVPDSVNEDEGVYKKGDMKVSLEQFYKSFDILGLKKPIVISGWFEKTLSVSLPKEIAFVLLDADLYSSTLISLQEIYPRLNKGAICLLGVYYNPDSHFNVTSNSAYRSPGVKKACDQFFKDKSEHIDTLYAGNYTSGYFQKL